MDILTKLLFTTKIKNNSSRVVIKNQRIKDVFEHAKEIFPEVEEDDLLQDFIIHLLEQSAVFCYTWDINEEQLVQEIKKGSKLANSYFTEIYYSSEYIY